MKKGFLIDMDGVIYRSSQLIEGAVDFIRMLREWDIPFLFLTNNSQRTRRDVATKLQRMGMPVEEGHIFTCAMATARRPWVCVPTWMPCLCRKPMSSSIVLPIPAACTPAGMTATPPCSLAPPR